MCLSEYRCQSHPAYESEVAVTNLHEQVESETIDVQIIVYSTFLSVEFASRKYAELIVHFRTYGDEK